MKTKSKCRTCGEKILETGNYSFKILKAKRIPKKAQKLLGTMKNHDESTAALSHTKFGRFLLKRSTPTNILDITCGNCSASSQIRISKPFSKLPETEDMQITATSMNSSSLLDTTTLNSSKKRRKRNKNKDLNAGLVIPSSMNNSTNSCNTSTDICDSPNTYLFQSTLQNPDSMSHLSNNNKSSNKKTTEDKERNLNNLRKTLLKSRQNANSNKKTTLKDFLSSM